MNKRYIEIDSTYRDRTRFPHQAQFEILLSQSGNKTALNASDPIIDSYPYYPNPLPAYGSYPVFAGGTGAYPILDSNASTVDNYYINSVLHDMTTDEARTITSYTGASKTVGLSAPFSGSFNTTDAYNIRKSIYSESGSIDSVGIPMGITALPNSVVVLPNTSSSSDEAYTGKYLFITSNSGSAYGTLRLITRYYGSQRAVVVSPPYTASSIPVAGDTYEILPFSRDSSSPLVYNGSSVSQMELANYEVQLVRLTIPNTLLFSGHGGTITNYPYVYVEFTNLMCGGNRNIIYSNNPNVGSALFKVPITDITSSPFVKLDVIHMTQTIRFKPNDNFKFSVYLPNGEILKTRPDNMSPYEPDPNLQMSALFGIKRL